MYKCTSYILLLSQQVLIRFIKPWFSLQYAGQSNYNGRLWQQTNKTHLVTRKPHIHVQHNEKLTYIRTFMGTQEHTGNTVTLAHPHACTDVHFNITQSNRTSTHSWSYAVGELSIVLTVLLSWFYLSTQ